MAYTAALAKKRKMDAFHQHHEDFPAARQNQTYLLPRNSNSASGKSLAEFQVSALCTTQYSRLFNGTSANGIGKSAPDSNPLVTFPRDTDLPLAQPVEDNFGSFYSDKVDETIVLFRMVLSAVRLKNMSNVYSVNDHIKAANFLRKQGKWLNTEKRLGAIPGVEIGDTFQFMAELRVIGLHCQFRRGIDYVRINGRKLATSVVDSGRYSKTDYRRSPDVLIYSGEGGNPRSRTAAKHKDQTLKRGNQALENSMMMKNPIRVVRKGSSKSSRFVYEGLYKVEDYKQVRGKYGKLVYEFKFRRMKQPGKPQACRTRGRKPCVLKDITNLMNPKSDDESMGSSGCDCTDGCSDSKDCSCKIKNGGIIPYNYKECLVSPSPLIFECGPSCKCFESCLNRVSQRRCRVQHVREGPMFELERFRCQLGFLGVRSRSFIPKGSFVCEYGKGIGRLINRSTSPNLLAQNVLCYHHKDESRPHIMLFAMEDIHDMKELTIGLSTGQKEQL